MVPGSSFITVTDPAPPNGPRGPRRPPPRRPRKRPAAGRRRGRLRGRPDEERLHDLQPERGQELRLRLPLPDRGRLRPGEVLLLARPQRRREGQTQVWPSLFLGQSPHWGVFRFG